MITPGESYEPRDEADLAEIVRQAANARAPLEIIGGGSRAGLGRPLRPKTSVCVRALSGVTLYDPGALTLSAKAGTPVEAIEALLKAQNQHLAFEPIDHRTLYQTSHQEPTIGGAAAVNACGPRRLTAGSMRDAMLGVRFVNGLGLQQRAGGRVMKNVTGYDVTRLHAGALGAFGALTEITLKVLPKPERSANLALLGLCDTDALHAMSAALGSAYGVDAAAHIPSASNAPNLTLLRVEGFDASVAHRLERLKDLLRGQVGEIDVFEGAKAVQRWREIRDGALFAADQDAIWRVSLKPSDAPDFVAALGVAEGARAYYDWGGGLVWLNIAPGSAVYADDAGAAQIRATLAPLGGSAILLRAADEIRKRTSPYPLSGANTAALEEAVRSRFDPYAIFNPGRRWPPQMG